MHPATDAIEPRSAASVLPAMIAQPPDATATKPMPAPVTVGTACELL
jgi:hypothetical protein